MAKKYTEENAKEYLQYITEDIMRGKYPLKGELNRWMKNFPHITEMEEFHRFENLRNEVRNRPSSAGVFMVPEKMLLVGITKENVNLELGADLSYLNSLPLDSSGFVNTLRKVQLMLEKFPEVVEKKYRSQYNGIYENYKVWLLNHTNN